MYCDILSVLLADLSHLIASLLFIFIFQSVLDLSVLLTSIFVFVIVLLVDLLLGMEVWWKQDVVFRTPKVHLFCDFSTPITYNSSSNAVLSQLYRHLVVDSLYKPLYAAVLAGYKASFGLTTLGFTMKFYGYSDKETMKLFINTAVQHARKIGKMHLFWFECTCSVNVCNCSNCYSGVSSREQSISCCIGGYETGHGELPVFTATLSYCL